MITFDGNDPEASTFATDLIKSLEDGGATVIPEPSAIFVGQMPLLGLTLQPAKDFDAGLIAAALSSVALVQNNESLKGFPERSPADFLLYVGHKPQPF